ncbi:hypothetical protein LHYA1_G002020 [Lachnellula hyalina]|uniref:Uncharacterized protein n=1 Tax=Lachnellula hyalina TaxID=1316788 RepID=A0A8H8R908_9HELO|nr:uncharacterized protein LHYA1_G002020 [Lachnellula hyalina]TVY29797.1 hypothetical protein LHYA1_G002020 [Lachnellula hyalina]
MSTSPSLLRSARHNVRRLPFTASSSVAPKYLVKTNSRCLATVNPGPRALPEISFTGSFPRYAPTPSDPKKPSDERTVKLGKTKLALRILQARLPTLLQSPLPQEILSPQITLHLFPSTHPHLPAVSGRVAYSAALWTSPIAWGRLPHLKLSILSERMVKRGSNSSSRPEQLIVRWSTIGKTRGKGTGALYKGIGAKDNVDKITEWLGGGKGEDDSKEFTGLFIFEFDEEGRIVSHTIEHVEEGGNWDQGVGAKVVGLTDWLLGGLKKNGREEGTPCPACWTQEGEEQRRRR